MTTSPSSQAPYYAPPRPSRSFAKSWAGPRRRYAIDDRLIEIDLGHWNGKTVDEIRTETPEAWDARDADKWGYRVPGGESYRDAAARTREFLLTLTGPTVIVGHGASGRILRGYLCDYNRHDVAHMKTPQDTFWEIRGGREKAI